MYRIRRGLATVSVTALLTVGIVSSGTATAQTTDASVHAGTLKAAYHEETFRGEFVPNSGHSCGGKTYKTDSTLVTPAGPMRQYAWIFRNCGKTTLKRRVIIRLDRDGKCYSIPPGRTRTLATKYVAAVIARDLYERSAPC